jgi:protoporphyrinogen/coproporphyrinogen III oxidase
MKSKMRMIKMFLYARRLGASLDLAHPTEETFGLEKEPTVEYILNNYDNDILEYIAWPIFCEIFLGNPEDNSKAPLLATLKNLTRFSIYSFSQGMGMLPERLQRDLDIRLSSPVERVSPAGPHGRYVVKIGGENPMSMECDYVIFAVPVPLVPTILEDMEPELKLLCNSVTYSPSIVTALAFDKSFPDTAMIVNLCRDRYRVVGTLVADNLKGLNRAPGDGCLMTAVLVEKAARRLLEASDEQVTQEVVEEVCSLLPCASDSLLFSKVYRWKHGAVQLPPGALRTSHELRTALRQHTGRIGFAGDGLYKSSLELAFNTGVDAANKAINEFQQKQ